MNQVAKTRTTRTSRRSRLGRILSAGVLAVLVHGAVGIFLSVSGALASLSPSALPPLVEGLDARQAASEEPLSVEELVEDLERPVTPSVDERKVDFGPGDYQYKRQLSTGQRMLERGVVADVGDVDFVGCVVDRDVFPIVVEPSRNRKDSEGVSIRRRDRKDFFLINSCIGRVVVGP